MKINIKINFLYLLILCLCQISLLALSAKSYGQTITIGEGGDFATLSQAASSLNPGDEVVILNQVFSNGAQYLENINGLPGQPITIIGETNHGPIFRGGNEAIHLSNCNYIVIDGLVFEQQTVNSINMDDGANYATPSTNITVKNCVFRDMVANGNNDFLKMAGVDNFLVSNCSFTNGVGSGDGSGIDMVGCHQGIIQDCVFDNPGGFGVSCKGGSQYINIERNIFKNTRERAVAVGGSTGLTYFRPPLPNPIVNAFEASDINVFSNVFMNDKAPIAFVGAVNSTFRNNTIYKPQNWVIRILQENSNNGFLQCKNNEFSNNIIYLQNDLLEVNIGSNTNAGSFTFSHNAWYNESSSNWAPNLPATAQNQLISNPLFVNAANEDFTLSNQSPFIGNGFPYAAPTTDFKKIAYSNPPSRGAFANAQNNSANFLSWTTIPTSVSNGDNLFTLDYSIDQNGILAVHLYDANWQPIGEAIENVSPGTRQSTLTLTANGVSPEINHIEVQLLNSSWGDIGVTYLYEIVPSGNPQPPAANFLSWTTTPTSVSNGNNSFTLDYSIDQNGILAIHLYDANWQPIGKAIEYVSPGTRQSTLTLAANGVSSEINHIEAQLLNTNWGDIGVQYLYEIVPSDGIPPSSDECDCPDAAEPGNTVIVQNVSQLRAALDQAKNQGGNMTIKLEPGEYKVDNTIVIGPNMHNLTIMGTTENRDKVFIKGLGAKNSAVGVVILVQADNFTAAHLTVGESSTHAIQVQGERDADDFTAVNVRFVDVYEQILKVSMGPNAYSDNGRVLCSAFEFTAGVAYHDYTRAIDALKCKNWLVSNNVIKGIRSPNNEITEHSILFWRASEGTIVSNNQIMNCDRGIGFGLGDKAFDGHIGGLIMNNFVHTNRDVGIGIEHSPNTKVYNNTVITDNYPRSIEYRFSATTNTRIFNNLVSGNITKRDGAPDAVAENNYPVTDFNIFADAGNHDYHLVGIPSGIVDTGTPLNEVTTDIDCDNRFSDAGIDIGADEASNFETQDCPEQLTIDPIITTGVYKAKTITAPMVAVPGHIVIANSKTTFQAEEFVYLESILIPKDANFEINIKNCNE